MVISTSMADTPPKKNYTPSPETIKSIGNSALSTKSVNLLKSKNPSVKLGIGDDAAIFKPAPGHELVFSTLVVSPGPTGLCLQSVLKNARQQHAKTTGIHNCLIVTLSFSCFKINFLVPFLFAISPPCSDSCTAGLLFLSITPQDNRCRIISEIIISSD